MRLALAAECFGAAARPVAAQAFLTQAPALATITIDEQVWLARNLAVTTFRNGDPIPRITDGAEWAAAGRARQPAQSAYGHNEARAAREGLRYNYAAVSDPRGLCPQGFRVPADADWNALGADLGPARAALRMKARSAGPQTRPAAARAIQGAATMPALAACPPAFAPSAASFSPAGRLFLVADRTFGCHHHCSHAVRLRSQGFPDRI